MGRHCLVLKHVLAPSPTVPLTILERHNEQSDVETARTTFTALIPLGTLDAIRHCDERGLAGPRREPLSPLHCR